LVNDELDWMRKEAVVAYCVALSRPLGGWRLKKVTEM
jgi:hypothetical protein